MDGITERHLAALRTLVASQRAGRDLVDGIQRTLADQRRVSWEDLDELVDGHRIDPMTAHDWALVFDLTTRLSKGLS